MVGADSQRFTCPVLLRNSLGPLEDFGHGPVTLSGAHFPMPSPILVGPTSGSYNPGGPKSPGLGSSAFARHYLRNRFLFLFLRLLRCFTSPGIACSFPILFRNERLSYYPSQVTPFGNLRVKAYLPLTEAYRSLSRPSSPVSTKASTICP